MEADIKIRKADPSIEFHERIGFQLNPGDDEIDGFPVTRDYNRPGDHKVRFTKLI
jgi:hypothetical protein